MVKWETAVKCCHLDATWPLHSGTKGRFRYLSGGEQASNAIQHPNRQQSLDSVGDIAKQRQKQNREWEARGNLLEVLVGNEREEKRVTMIKMHCICVIKNPLTNKIIWGLTQLEFLSHSHCWLSCVCSAGIFSGGVLFSLVFSFLFHSYLSIYYCV